MGFADHQPKLRKLPTAIAAGQKDTTNSENDTKSKLQPRRSSKKLLGGVAISLLTGVMGAAKLGLLPGGQDYTDALILHDAATTLLTGVLAYGFVQVKYLMHRLVLASDSGIFLNHWVTNTLLYL